MGTQRDAPVGVDRTDFAFSAACRRWWSAVAGHAGCTQRNSVGLGDRGTVAGTAQEIPAYETCHRRFQQWVREGKLERILRS